jgi:hypothetical protein
VNGGKRERRFTDVDRVRCLVSRTATIAAVPTVTGAVAETVAMVTTVAFWTNAWLPWALLVTNGIA